MLLDGCVSGRCWGSWVLVALVGLLGDLAGPCRLERGGLGSPKKMLGHADLEPPHWEESAGASLLMGGDGMPVNRKANPLLRGA